MTDPNIVPSSNQKLCHLCPLPEHPTMNCYVAAEMASLRSMIRVKDADYRRERNEMERLGRALEDIRDDQIIQRMSPALFAEKVLEGSSVETIAPPPADDEAGERLANFIQAYQKLSDMSAQQLVNIALEHCMGRTQMQELVIEELCSRVYPNWPNEDPADRPAVKATAEHPAAAHYRSLEGCCEDCPPIGYPTDKTRCDECPRSSKNGTTQS